MSEQENPASGGSSTPTNLQSPMSAASEYNNTNATSGANASTTTAPSSDVSWQPESSPILASPGSRPGSAHHLNRNQSPQQNEQQHHQSFVIGDDVPLHHQQHPSTSARTLSSRLHHHQPQQQQQQQQQRETSPPRSRPATGGNGSARAGAAVAVASARSNRVSSAASTRSGRGSPISFSDAGDESTTIPQFQQHISRPANNNTFSLAAASAAAQDERSPMRAGANVSAASDPNTEENILNQWKNRWSAAFNLTRQSAAEAQAASTRRRRQTQALKRSRSEIAAAKILPRMMSPAADLMLREREMREESLQKKNFWENRVALLRREVEKERLQQKALQKEERARQQRLARQQEEMKWEDWHASLYDRRTRLVSESAIAAEATAKSGGVAKNSHHEKLRSQHLEQLKEMMERSILEKQSKIQEERLAEQQRRDEAERHMKRQEKENRIRVQISKAEDMASKEKRLQREEERKRQAREAYIHRMEEEAHARKELEGDTNQAIRQSHELVEQIRKLRRARAKLEEQMTSQSPSRSNSPVRQHRTGSASAKNAFSTPSSSAARATPQQQHHMTSSSSGTPARQQQQ